MGCVEGRGEVVAVPGVEDVPCCLGAEVLCRREGGGGIEKRTDRGGEQRDLRLPNREGEVCVVFDDEGGGMRGI